MKARSLADSESKAFFNQTSGLHDALLSDFSLLPLGYSLSFSEYYLPVERRYNENGCHIILICDTWDSVKIEVPRMIHRFEIDHERKGVSISSIDGSVFINCDLVSSIIIF